MDREYDYYYLLHGTRIIIEIWYADDDADADMYVVDADVDD